MTALFEPRTADADRALRRALGSARGDAPRFGVEHEFGVFLDGAQIDFRELIHELEIDGRAVHPTNPFHYVTREGFAVIADGIVAEIATPPIALERGFAGAGSAWADKGRAELDLLLPPRHSIVGGSTHLNFEADPAVVDRMALLFARYFSPALMLMMDQAYSPGMLVRPRPRRLELCGEYVRGDALVAASVFARGCVAAVQAHLGGARDMLPELIDIAIEPGRRRYGWYVDRAAFGVDLYDSGRAAALATVSGTTTEAGDFLVDVWRRVRRNAGRTATRAELDLVDRMVAGDLPLPLESGCAGTARTPPPRPPRAPHPGGLAAEVLRSEEVTFTPRCATWDWVAWDASSDRGSVVVEVPRAQLAGFGAAAGRGALDGPVKAAVATRGELVALTHLNQLGQAAFFSDVDPGPGLLPNDRYGIGGAPASSVRPGKREAEDRSSTRTRSRARTVAAVVLLVAAALVAALLSPGRNASAGTGDLQDPRSLFSDVAPIEFGDGILWFVLRPEEPWGSTPPDDLFSFFFEVDFTVDDTPGVMGWEVHDGTVTPLGPHPLLILEDGTLAGATGIPVGPGFTVEGTIRSGSWRDEQTSQAVFNDSSFALTEADLLPPDALANTEALFDLHAGTPIEPPPPPVPWEGLGTVVGDDVLLEEGGDGLVVDPTGDQQDYYGTFDQGQPDVASVDWVAVDFGPSFPPDVRRQRLEMICTDGIGPGAAPVCPPDLGFLADAGSWFFADISLTGPGSLVQAGVAWFDPSRPAFEGPGFDPNTGRNTSLETFSGPAGYDLGTTTFDGSTFSSGPSDDVLVVLRNDGAGILLNGDTVGTAPEMPHVFVVTGGGIDLVDLPSTPAGSITVGPPPESGDGDSDDSGSTTDDGSGGSDDSGSTADDGSGGSDGTDDSGSTTDDGSTTDAGSTTDETGTDGGGSSPLPWILIITGLVSVGTGVYLRLRQDDTGLAATTTVVTGFEKGTTGRLTAVG